MFCFKCGSEIAEGHEFCGKCGTAVNGLIRTVSEDVYEKKPEGKSFLRKLCLFVGVVLVLLLGIKAIETNRGEGGGAGTQYAGPLTRHEKQNLFTGSHTVEPLRMSYYKFTILPEMQNARVHGRFEVTGGSGNDLKAVLTDEDGYLNYSNGHSCKAYYVNRNPCTRVWSAGGAKPTRNRNTARR